MANLFATGFHGITTATIGRRSAFAVISSVGANGRNGVPAVRLENGSANAYNTEAWADQTTIYYGAVLKPVAVLASEDAQYGTLLSAFDVNAFVAHLSINYDFTDETISVIGPGPSFTEFYAGTPGVWPVDTWACLEVALTVHDSAGTVSVWLDGVLLYAGTGLDTRQGTHSPYGVNAITVGGFGMDDLYCEAIYANDASGSECNSVLGPFCVGVNLPAADDAVDFAPLSSTNKSNIDDGNSPDDDTSYNSSSTVTDRDMFTVAGYKATSHKVFAVIARALAKATAADGRELRTVINDGSDHLGTSTGIDDTGYTEVSHTIELPTSLFASPEAAESALNGLKIGYEVSA